MRRLLIAAGLLAFAATLILSLVQAHAGRGEKEYVPNIPIVSPDGQRATLRHAAGTQGRAAFDPRIVALTGAMSAVAA